MKKLKAVKYAYSIFACALIAFGLAVLLKGWFPAEPFMLFGGILMIGFGAIRILGYFSKDALQLAFQFDLFLGIASAVLGCYMIWDTQAAGHIVMVLGVFPDRWPVQNPDGHRCPAHRRGAVVADSGRGPGGGCPGGTGDSDGIPGHCHCQSADRREPGR